MSILPNAASNRNKADTDADVGEQVDRALHGVGDGEVGIIALLEGAHD